VLFPRGASYGEAKSLYFHKGRGIPVPFRPSRTSSGHVLTACLICLGWELDMTHFLKTFLSDTSGAAAAEYALILAIVGSGIAVAALALGTSITTAMNAAGTCITSQGATC
jgi:pilus assembly protein Flp/PilA